MKQLLKLKLQLFAGEDGEKEPTQEVENEDFEETDDLDEDYEDDDDVDFDDTDDDEEDETEQEVETKKVSNDKVKSHTDNIKNQKQQNYNNAKARIERRRQEELNKAKREAYIEGIKKSTNGVNSFTGQPIKDETDVEIYETMCEMNEKGLDPVEDFYKYTAEKRRNEKEQIRIQNEAKEKENAKLNTEIAEFINVYGEDTLKKVLNDADFEEFSKDLVGAVPLKVIYDKFLKISANTETKAEQLAIKKDARRKSSSGALGKKSKTSSSILDLSPEEFQKAINEIARQY